MGAWINKLWYMYKMEYYAVFKKKTEFATTWMDLEDVIQSEIK
jgi:hypothetical protein